jgi:hypothetical protein
MASNFLKTRLPVGNATRNLGICFFQVAYRTASADSDSMQLLGNTLYKVLLHHSADNKSLNREVTNVYFFAMTAC